ncbi:MAG: nicotinate-nucleotide adenylyltransferase [Gammaproteobacteria bacterium]|nr:nicotinate-nucleotide adenylyltransferase [Gammaproteobacteria bacterium]MDH5274860.1 nicotinate-nucleotide adenylyltransferase [Gammaproteobacteria bacterium]
MTVRALTGRQQAIGIFGGTFDPVHIGHLRTAHELLTSLELAEVRFIPSRLPPHRPPTVAPEALRLRMLEAALDGLPGFRVDDRELRRPGPSYMVDTLDSLRAEVGPQPLCLLLGLDAFLGLPAWHRWQELPELAHIVVARRPGISGEIGGEAGELLRSRAITDHRVLASVPAGRVLMREVTQLEISSSAIRGLVAEGGDPRFLVPDAVRELILKTHIYANPREVLTRAQ